ncbi:MAG: hypothetical protein RLZZ627_1259 [Pseudomonadota bacterium]|jgi:hypothetical protein
MNTMAQLIEKKVHGIAMEHAKQLEADISIKEKIRGYVRDLHEGHGLFFDTAEAAEKMNGLADTIHGAIKAGLQNQTKASSVAPVLVNSPDAYFELAKACIDRLLLTKIRGVAQKRADALTRSIGQMDPMHRDLVLEAINEQHQEELAHRARVMQTLETDLQEIASRPDRKS